MNLVIASPDIREDSYKREFKVDKHFSDLKITTFLPYKEIFHKDNSRGCYFCQKALKMRKLANEELGRLDVHAFKSAGKNTVTVVLDNVRSLNNIGSIFRTCDAFRIEKLVLCGISTPPPHRDIHKTALGAELSVDWEYFDQTIEAVLSLKSRGHNIIAVEQTTNSISLQQFNHNLFTTAHLSHPSPHYALIFGHEIHGVAQEIVNLCDATIEIPQYGTKHSLNVAVAVGIVLWEIGRERG